MGLPNHVKLSSFVTSCLSLNGNAIGHQVMLMGSRAFSQCFPLAQRPDWSAICAATTRVQNKQFPCLERLGAWRCLPGPLLIPWRCRSAPSSQAKLFMTSHFRAHATIFRVKIAMMFSAHQWHSSRAWSGSELRDLLTSSTTVVPWWWQSGEVS